MGEKVKSVFMLQGEGRVGEKGMKAYKRGKGDKKLLFLSAHTFLMAPW